MKSHKIVESKIEIQDCTTNTFLDRVKVLTREMENVSRGPTFGDFCHYPYRGGSMLNNTIARLQSKLQRFLNLRCWSMGGET